ncbi:MFS transporter [Goodfellowiella coeruleoviolacea]|uniref:Major Facilitator Superfamily protein n=1 Tax=Goodfellowiella coeruleoviolacea TaxID=334858 RepID=A0AAE3KI36_9PSEU|nr:MFS transporter [Goodfellowiella coeruleoviolacea]MCP2168065.1 Major Facilitator Superfamily protein [Goodfellowiella coeruleoviolacea]
MASTTQSVPRPAVRRAALAASVGNTVELYDFLLYGTASATVFDQLFFPRFDPRIGTLLSLLTFGVGFLARPLGAVVIGHFGDRIGRRAMLVLTLTATGVCTALIGVLPSYESIGLLAPVLLVVLRLVQGFFLGGEQGGASLLAVEYAPPGRTGWYGSWTFLGSPLGLFLANAAVALAAVVSGDAFLSWGWRLPFLFGLVLVGLGLYVRLGIAESPAFQRVRAEAGAVRLPVVEVLRGAWRRVLLGAGVNLGFNMFIFVLATFVISYGQKNLGMARTTLLNASLLGGLAQAVSILLFARLSDRIGRLPVMLGGAVFLGVFAFPLFWLLETRQPALVLLAVVLGYFGSGAIFGVMPVYYAELFRTGVRYSGVSLSYQLGAVLGGGLSPAVAAALLGVTADHASWPISLYLVGGAVVSAVCLLALGETLRRAAPSVRTGQVVDAAVE